MFKIVCSVLLVVLVNGCATSNIDRNFMFNPGTEKGLLVGSITQDDKPGTFQLTSILYMDKLGGNGQYSEGVSVKSREKKYGGLLPVFEASDFEDYNGKLFVIELAEGVHEISRWLITNDSGLTISPRASPEPIYIEIKSSEIFYLGNIHFNLYTGENMFGMMMPAGAMPEIIDVGLRDIHLFKKKYPQFSDHKITMNSIKEGIWSAGAGTNREVTTPYIMPVK